MTGLYDVPAVGVFDPPQKVETIAIGVEIWCKPEARRDADDQALGGIVVEILPGWVNSEGELLPARYKVFDRYRRFDDAFRTVSEDEIDRSTMGLPQRGELAKVARTLAAEFGKAKQARGTRRHGSGHLSEFEIGLSRWIFALVRAYASPNKPAVAEVRHTAESEF